MSQTPQSKEIKPTNVEDTDESDEGSDDEEDVLKEMNHATQLYFLDALYQLGWKPEKGRRFTTKEVLAELKIPEHQIGYCHNLFNKIAELGYMEVAKGSKFCSKFWFKEKPPTRRQIDDFLQETITPLARYSKQAKFAKEIGVNMKALLKDEVSFLTVLFPEDSRQVNMEDAYHEIGKMGDSAAAGFFKMAQDPTLKQVIVGDE